MAVTVHGDERAELVILRAGRRAQDQTNQLAAAGRSASGVSPGNWQDRSGKLAASLQGGGVDATADTLRLTSDVPYARFVFYGTSRQAPRPPSIDADALVAHVTRSVANDLIGE